MDLAVVGTSSASSRRPLRGGGFQPWRGLPAAALSVAGASSRGGGFQRFQPTVENSTLRYLARCRDRIGYEFASVVELPRFSAEFFDAESVVPSAQAEGAEGLGEPVPRCSGGFQPILFGTFFGVAFYRSWDIMRCL
jgi:hypothetical protein